MKNTSPDNDSKPSRLSGRWTAAWTSLIFSGALALTGVLLMLKAHGGLHWLGIGLIVVAIGGSQLVAVRLKKARPESGKS